MKQSEHITDTAMRLLDQIGSPVTKESTQAVADALARQYMEGYAVGFGEAQETKQ